MLARFQSRWLRWRRRLSRAEWAARHLGFAVSAEPPHAAGLLLIQIDGLGRGQLEQALRRGRMPFLRRLLRRRGYELRTFYSGLPSSTPAVQAELHYGVRTAVPAFSFFDARAGGIGVMMHPDWAKRIEADLAAQGEGLLRGGSSWSNIYTGGAEQSESHFCGASIGPGDMWRSVRLRLVALLALLHVDALVRLVGLLALELCIGLRDALRGVFTEGRSWRKEFAFLFARVAVCVGLRELVTLGGAVDVARGLPVVHVNFLGYDEQSHRRGPGSAFAHWTLRGIDRGVRRLHHAARRSGRRAYDVWIFSDHGQARARQARTWTDGGLEGLVRRHWPHARDHTTSHRGRRQERPSPGHWLGGPRRDRREAAHLAVSQLSDFEKQEFAVAAMGPVGHVYCGRKLTPDATRRLAAALVQDGVPGVLLRRDDGAIDWLEAGGEHRLPAHADLLDGDAPLQQELARDLVALCRNPHAGDLVVLGWAPGGVRWTFAAENGAHAGPAAEEVQGFAALPAGTWLPPGTEHFIRPAALRAAARRLLGREHATTQRYASARAAADDVLRIATYNVHGCLGTDGHTSPARIARVLEQCDADVIALQEVDAGRARSRAEDQLALLAGALRMQARFCPTVTRGGESYGHGLLARMPLTVVRDAVLPAGGGWRLREARRALWVSLRWRGEDVQFVATHLGLGRDERARQVEALLGEAWLGAVAAGAPVVLCGDLNLYPGSWNYRRLVGRLRDVQAHAPGHVAERTFPSLFPVRRIDHIMVSPHFEVCAVRVIRSALAVVASDHLPLVAELRLAEAKESNPSPKRAAAVPSSG